MVTYCGTIRPDEDGFVAACKTHPYDHQIKGIPNSCKRRACPECYPDWSEKGSQRFSSVLNGRIREIVPKELQERLCRALENQPLEPGPEDGALVKEIHSILEAGDKWLPRHVVFSPPLKVIAHLVDRTEKALVKKGINIQEDAYRYRDEFYRVFHKKYRRKLDQVIRLAGLTAYAEITHDIRLKKEKETDKADRQMDANRYRAVLDRQDWRYNVRFSPHSHTAGWGRLMDAETFHRVTQGWIYINYGTVYNAEGLARYLLSHAPDNPGLHSIRYGGELNPSKMCVEGEIKIPEFPPCEDCLKEGTPRNKAEMVLAKLGSVEYVKDSNHRSSIASWEFSEDGVSNRPYRITKVIQVYRRRPPPPSTWEIQDILNRILQERRDTCTQALLSDEAREEHERLEKLERKERERIRQAALWVPRSAWVKMNREDRDLHKWRQWYSPEEFAAAPASEKVKTFEWV
jgi:hypothetical protein